MQLAGPWVVGPPADHDGAVDAADNSVSEAFYFTDPECNGVEQYWDRPRFNWN